MEKNENLSSVDPWGSRLQEIQRVIQDLGKQTAALKVGAQILSEALALGHRIFLFGNGGSAAQAAHIAAELVGRFQTDHRPLPAIALTANLASITAIANDFGYDQVFSRQLEALAMPGDVVLALSTSGQSPNVLRAVEVAQRMDLKSLAITGLRGHALCQRVDYCIQVSSKDPARIQEATLVIAHLWCEFLETQFLKEERHG